MISLYSRGKCAFHAFSLFDDVRSGNNYVRPQLKFHRDPVYSTIANMTVASEERTFGVNGRVKLPFPTQS